MYIKLSIKDKYNLYVFFIIFTLQYIVIIIIFLSFIYVIHKCLFEYVLKYDVKLKKYIIYHDLSN